MARQTGLPKSTPYKWLVGWNLAQQATIKALISRRGQGVGSAPQVDASDWEGWRDSLQQPVQHWTGDQPGIVLFLVPIKSVIVNTPYLKRSKWSQLRGDWMTWINDDQTLIFYALWQGRRNEQVKII